MSYMPIVLLLICILFIVVSTTKLNLHAFLALLIAAIFFGICSGMPLADVVKNIEDGFGGTLGKIGIVIIAGTIIGTFLEKSGGAYSLAESILKVIGKKNVTPAMALIGYIVSIPVFADSGFVILTPLNKTLTKRAGLSLATTSIALALGLMITHCLVPPPQASPSLQQHIPRRRHTGSGPRTGYPVRIDRQWLHPVVCLVLGVQDREPGIH